MDRYLININSSEELINYLKEAGNHFQLEQAEADVIMSYMSETNCQLTYKGKELWVIDTAKKLCMIYSPDSLIDCICEWNFEQIQEWRVVPDNAERMAALMAQKEILDRMFAKTYYSEFYTGYLGRSKRAHFSLRESRKAGAGNV